jgi:hypothetical protein
MVLNKYSYVHLQIRKLSSQLEVISGMKLITDFDNEFVEVRFMNTLGYIVIDWRRNAIYTLSHSLNAVEMEIVKDIMLYCDWLETGQYFERKGVVKNGNV